MSRNQVEKQSLRFGGIELLRWVTLFLIIEFHVNDYLKNDTLFALNDALGFLRLQIFFGISGFLVFTQIRASGFSYFAIRKSRRLLIPFYTYGVVYYFSNQLLTTTFSFRKICSEFLQFLTIGNYHLWFLQVIFIVYLVGYQLVQFAQKFGRFYSVLFLILISVLLQFSYSVINYLPINQWTLFNFNKVIFFLPYFLMGSVARVLFTIVQERHHKRYFTVCIAIVCGSILIDLDSRDFGSNLLADLALIALLFIFASIKVTWFTKFSSLVMPVYLVHPIFIFLLVHWFSEQSNLLNTIGMAFLSLVLSLASIEVYRRVTPVWAKIYLGM